jgi:hypothetical protein
VKGKQIVSNTEQDSIFQLYLPYVQPHRSKVVIVNLNPIVEFTLMSWLKFMQKRQFVAKGPGPARGEIVGQVWLVMKVMGLGEYGQWLFKRSNG